MRSYIVLKSLFLVGLFTFVISLVACSAPPPRDSGQIVDPTMPPLTPIPTELAVEDRILGHWIEESGSSLDTSLLPQPLDFTLYSFRHVGSITSNAQEVGKWEVLSDQRILIEITHRPDMTATLRGNILVAEDTGSWTVSVLRRSDSQGNIYPASIETSNLPLPLFDVSKVVGIKIRDEWRGLTIETPVVAQFTLTVSSGLTNGTAFFSHGSIEPVSATVPITIEPGTISQALKSWAQTPVEISAYRSYMRITDDFPHVQIEITTNDDVIFFETRSQGRDKLPWLVIYKKQYCVSYSDLPAVAYRLLDPYLAREVQRTLSKSGVF